MAMLLRRLNTRLHRKDIQYILTSATLGGENDNDAVAAFAENLCNSRFTAGDVIRARRVKLTPPAVSKEPPAFFYKEVAAMIEGDKDPADILARIHDFDPNLPDDEMEALYQVIYSCLRNYYNQKYHDLLQRGYVVRFLKSVLTKNS